MNMVDLYIEEVGRHLPAKNREDLKREIRSLVEDAIDDTAQGKEPDEAQVVDVLKMFGSPEKVAASYQPPRYLIGPNLFPTFLMVVRIVVAVIAVLSAVGIGVSLGKTASDVSGVLSTIGEGMLNFLGSAAAALGNIVLVFAIIQWLSPDLKFNEEAWDPRSLKAEPDPERVTPAGPIFEIFLALAAILLFNVYSQWIGITIYQDGRWLHAPVLTEAFLLYLPWINLLLVVGVVLQSLLLRHRSWTPGLRWLAIGINAANIILTGWILTGPSFVGIDTAALVQAGWDPAQASGFMRAVPAFTTLFRLALGIALAAQIFDLVKKLYRMVSKKISLPAGLAR
jgi:hypothetical protein